MKPIEAMRSTCRNCLACGACSEELLKNCEGDRIQCSFYPYRFNKNIHPYIIRKYCINNCMGKENEYIEAVLNCITKDCGNYEFRMGIIP